MSDLTYGWELIYNNCLKEITRKEDVLLVFIHWYLTKKGFRCLGLGSDKEFDPEVAGSEMLPTGWSAMGSDVAIRYALNKKLFVLRGLRSEDQIVFNLLRVEDYSVSSMIVPLERTVLGTRGTLTELIPSYQDVLEKMRTTLIHPVHKGNQRDSSAQTVAQEPSQPCRNMSQPPRPSPLSPLVPGGAGSGVGVEPNPWDPYGVGRSDLYPVGGGGRGGMLFNPFYGPNVPDPGLGVPGGLPRGAIPPGARFDPFGPPAPNRGRGPGAGPRRYGDPEPDHMPPPGYDDMFM